MTHRHNNAQHRKKQPPDVMQAAEAKKDELEALAVSEEGQKVKSMLGGDAGIAAMVENNDIEGFRSALGSIMKTNEGAELMRRLSEIMK